VPGHTWQGAYLAEHHADLPLISSMLGFNAFVEGWALYAEQLGDEMGMYENDWAGQLGYLQAQRFRAIRLVVDTGMHYLGWTREQAIQFMAENTALSLHNITAEVDRYIAWPGQAVAYKTGELKIRELRRLAEEQAASQAEKACN
jgi:uncharacterized protein (DUF885 family)